MSIPIITIFIGLSYVVLFGAYSWLRREGLSLRFAIEAVIFTLLFSGWMVLTGSSLSPIFFLALLYLITMRVRVLVDLGAITAKRGNIIFAERIFKLAQNLWPDKTGNLIVQVNQATAFLQKGELDKSIALFKVILSQAESGYLGVKYEAAAHYNLGVAYQRKGSDAQATVAFNSALDTWPASEYARRAEDALKRQRRKDKSSTNKKDI